MNVTRTILFLLLSFLLLDVPLQAQEKEKHKGKGKEKPGILERIGEEVQKKKDKDDDSDHQGGFAAIVWSFIDPVDLVNALANMKPGPFPYNSTGDSFAASKEYPGGVVQVQGSYFQNSSVTGFLWRYRYRQDRFSFVTELDLFQEDRISRVDYQSWASMRLGWDFLSQPQFRAGGQLGFRSLLEQQTGTTGPEIGVHFVALPGQPLVVEGQSTLSLLNGNFLSTHSASVGVIVWRFEVLFGGYLYRAPETVLDGWQIGFRAWL